MQRPRGARSSLGATLTSTSRSRWEAARWRPAYSWPAKTHHGGAGRGARLAVLLRPAGQLLVGALHRAAVQRAQARLARRLGGGRRAAPPERRAPRRQRLLAPVLVLEVAPPLAPQPPQRLLAPGQPARAAALQPTLPYPLSPRTRARLGAVSGAWSRASPPRPRRSAPCSRPGCSRLAESLRLRPSACWHGLNHGLPTRSSSARRLVTVRGRRGLARRAGAGPRGLGAHWRSDSAEPGRSSVLVLRAAGGGRRGVGAPPSEASSSLPSSAAAAARAFFSRLGLRPARVG